MPNTEFASRTYVVGLPVVLTVHSDGSVTAEVDLSEASDLDDASITEDMQALPQDFLRNLMDADSKIIEDAVVQATVKVTA